MRERRTSGSERGKGTNRGRHRTPRHTAAGAATPTPKRPAAGPLPVSLRTADPRDHRRPRETQPTRPDEAGASDEASPLNCVFGGHKSGQREECVMEGDARRYFRDELREARSAAFRDAEGFHELIFAIERLGCTRSGKAGSLANYRDALVDLARHSPLAD